MITKCYLKPENPTHKALVENLGKVYTRTLFGSQPVHPPAGDDQTSADDKAPTYIYIYTYNMYICRYKEIYCNLIILSRDRERGMDIYIYFLLSLDSRP